MNDMERTLFIKGLENLYGSVLMSDDQALEQIEQLVCLARELDDPGAAVQPMAQEFAWIHRYVEACWPESRFTIHGEGTDYANLKMVDELNVEEYGVAFRKGSDVAAAVDTAFDELKADGTMGALAEKYDLTLAE